MVEGNGPWRSQGEATLSQKLAERSLSMKCQILGEEATFYKTDICPLGNSAIEISADTCHLEGRREGKLFREGFSPGDLGRAVSVIVF